jgi:hypothetical protein
VNVVSLDQSLIVGLDLGNTNVKVYALNGSARPIRILFSSALGQFHESHNVRSKVIAMNGAHRLESAVGSFLVGDLASEISKNVSFRNTNEFRFSSRQIILPLTLTALGLLAKQSGHTQFSVVTGVPLTHFAEQIPVVRKMLNGIHTFVLDGKEYTVQIECNSNGVIPCSFGPWADYALDDNGQVPNSRQHAKVGIIDFGSATTDLSTIIGRITDGEYDVDCVFWRSIPTAWINVVDRIREQLSANHKIDANFFEVDRAIREGRGIGKVSAAELSGYRSDAEDDVAISLAAQMQSEDCFGLGNDFDALVFVGGPTKYMASKVAREYGQALYTPSDPLFATARGYHAWGKHIAYG